MPIITREHILGGLVLALFVLAGVLLSLLGQRGEEMASTPQALWYKDKVYIQLRGAVSQTGERSVAKEKTVWQVVAEGNALRDWVQWSKLPIGRRVYEGMDLYIYFRQLRQGERIPWSLVQQSGGRLLCSLPCWPQKGCGAGGLDKKVFERFLAQKRFQSCKKRYIRGWKKGKGLP